MTKAVEDILKHHGVKGMRWGVRRDNPGGTTAGGGHHVGNVSNLVSEDHARVTSVQSKIKTAGTKAVSNKELQDVITRMNLEQQYARLSTQKATISTGQAKVKQVLALAKTAQEVHSLATGGLANAIGKALNGSAKSTVLPELMSPKDRAKLFPKK